MPESRTIGTLARQVRSKNAGPFWLTIDVFLDTDEDYAKVAGDPAITPKTVGRLYGVAAEDVRIFRLAELRVIKISFPRAVPAGSFGDRDLHGGQQHVPLSSTVLAVAPS
jgi:hypothetical protein